MAAPSILEDLLGAGWLAEGYGPSGAVYCVSGYEDPDDFIVYYNGQSWSPPLTRMPPRTE